MEIRPYLEVMVERDASDIYFTVDLPPIFRVQGITQRFEGDLTSTVFEEESMKELCRSVMKAHQWDEFLATKEMNLALSYEGLGRFRVNAFHQRGHMGMVIRQIKAEIMTVDDLRLPQILKEVVMTQRGLILVVGATGSGKSTTLAAMIDHRNSTSPGHVITIEDPVEYVHRHKQCVITQREVGFDTDSFEAALKNTLRQAPDVILIGEIRDRETMEAALTFSETGHLCLGTLHSNNANQAIERVINFFEEERHNQIYLQLSLNLRAILSQRLIRTVDNKRAAAVEILLDTPRIKDLIKGGKVDILKEAMEQGEQEGCRTFDQAIFELYQEKRIDLDQALSNADSENNLRLKIQAAALKQGEKGATQEKKGEFRIRRDILSRG